MTTLPVGYESYWMLSAARSPYPALLPGESIEADVAVVGGGVAGLSVAWELARAGCSVAVLEADRIAAGVTGHTSGKLSALHGLDYSRIAASRGPESAQLYAASQQGAVEHLAAIVAELGIECELERVPAYTYVESEYHVDEVRAEADAARAAGLPASFTTDVGLPFPVRGAVRVEDQAQFHPRKYLLALAEDLVARGGLIRERTRVLDLDDSGGAVLLTAECGAEVRAADVVVATHYPVFDGGFLSSRLTPRRELVLSALLPAEEDPQGTYTTPERGARTVQTAPYPFTPGKRLLVVTGERFLPGIRGIGTVSARYERLAAWTYERFPSARLAHRWATQDIETTEGLPYIGRFHPSSPHSYLATGFGGWGMSGGVLAGQLLAAQVLGEELPEWAGLYDPGPRAGDAPAMLRRKSAVARSYVGDRLRPSYVDSVAEVAPGTGAIVRIGGRRCAVHRTAEGELRVLSPRCTHLGCLVRFNDAESAWECPCHGSRFGTEGEVLEGPATRPLERRDLGEEPEGE